MKRSTIKLVAIILLAVGILAIVIVPKAPKTENYPISTIVVELHTDEDVVVVKDFNGNLWEFYGCEDWAVGDICAMIMNDCGTAEIYDDEIVSVRYCGWVD